ncbi:winged helix DNA-binding domain-containing protein [Angustibacter luteus]|uniref:Winged helix DNA-binding domain-containing protein n=1 Tax=Angustibacter luteus TaxID=658456 RepID=A0ABW1JDB9_9ACTN
MTAGRPAAPPLAVRRLRTQGLTHPDATTPEQVVDRLLAVQAQDPRGFRLAVRSRSTGLTSQAVDTALSEPRSLVVNWLHRGTLHLVGAGDYWWLHPLTTPQLATASARRLEQEGVSPQQAARGAELIMDAVASGPQTRTALRALLDEHQVPTQRQALVHVLLATCLRYDLVRGPVVGGEQAFVSAAQWLGRPPPPLDRDEALARLARRYLVGHAPATADDLAYWAGITLGDARRAFAAVAGETTSDDDGQTWLTDSADAAESAGDVVPAPRLLGPFDPVLHGWRSRDPLLRGHVGVVTSNGVFRPSALVDGGIVATWRLAAGTLTIQPLEPIAQRDRKQLTRDAADVLAYLGQAERPAEFTD